MISDSHCQALLGHKLFSHAPDPCALLQQEEGNSSSLGMSSLFPGLEFYGPPKEKVSCGEEKSTRFLSLEK